MALKIRDTLKLKVPEVDQKQKDKLFRLIDTATSSKQRGSLLTEVEVSHSGIINRNKGYYPPEKMKSLRDFSIHPGGSRLAFQTFHEGKTEIWAMNVEDLLRSLD